MKSQERAMQKPAKSNADLPEIQFLKTGASGYQGRAPFIILDKWNSSLFYSFAFVRARELRM